MLDGVPDPPCQGQFWGKGRPIVKYRDSLPWAVQKWLNRSICLWVVDSDGPKEAQVQSYSPGCANLPIREGTLMPQGKHDWTIHLRRRCGLMSNYFDHLFIIWLFSGLVFGFCWLYSVIIVFLYLALQMSSVPVQMLLRPPLSSDHNHYWVNIIAVLFTNSDYVNALACICFHNCTWYYLLYNTACPVASLPSILLREAHDTGKSRGFAFLSQSYAVCWETCRCCAIVFGLQAVFRSLALEPNCGVLWLPVMQWLARCGVACQHIIF